MIMQVQSYEKKEDSSLFILHFFLFFVPYPIIVAEQNGRSWSAFRKI